ncbi:MAG: chromate transporter [Eubacteriales bacterium]
MLLLELFLTFLKIGAFTFGGGYAMLPLVQSEVLSKGWMTSEELVDFIAISESTPGPFAVNVSTYVGAGVAGVPGAICATLGVVLPSFVIILLIAGIFKAFQKNFAVQGVLKGLRPTVVGLISASVLSVGQGVFFPDGWMLSVLSSYVFWISAGIFLLNLVLIFRKISPILLIGLSALLGIGFGYLGEGLGLL